MGNRRKVRHSAPLRHKRASAQDVAQGMTGAEREFYDAMKEMAVFTYEAGVRKLRDAGVSEEDIEHMETGVRALCIAETWEMDLEKIFMDLVESKGTTISVRDAVAERLLHTSGVFFRQDASEDDAKE